VWCRWLESSTRLGGFRALKKTTEAPYTTKVNYRMCTSRGTTLKCTGYRWAPNLLKSVALAPGVLKCGAASTPHRRAPPQKGIRSTPREKLLKSAPRADQSC
jgi:hypothetical protein